MCRIPDLIGDHSVCVCVCVLGYSGPVLSVTIVSMVGINSGPVQSVTIVCVCVCVCLLG